MFGALRHALFGLGPRDVAGPVARFQGAEPPVRDRLCGIVDSFVLGYNLSMRSDTLEQMVDQLLEHEHERQGFAFEGAGMGLALRAMFTPGNRMLEQYLAGPGKPHTYMINVGAGWAFARFGWRHEVVWEQLGKTWHWLAWDGLGFHEVFFNYDRTIVQQLGRPAQGGFTAAAYDQGIGRAIWFVGHADPQKVAALIGSFPEERRADLWGGIGLAATYAGGVPLEALQALVRAAGEHATELSVGSALAWETRVTAGNPAPHNTLAVRVLAGGEPDVVLAAVRALLAELGEGEAVYPAIREGLRKRASAELLVRAG
jgi:hypothetical protein